MATKIKLGQDSLALEARDTPSVSSVFVSGGYLQVYSNSASTSIQLDTVGSYTKVSDLSTNRSWYFASSTHSQLWVVGGAGNDRLVNNTNKSMTAYGQGGADYLEGGNGNDTLNGGTGNDAIYAYGGNDVIYGNEGNDTLSGMEGNDAIYAGSGNDYIYGGNGNDYLNGGSRYETNYTYGGAGADTFVSIWGSEIRDWSAAQGDRFFTGV